MEFTATVAVGESPSDNYRLACAHEEMNPRRRATMEDCHRVVPALNSDKSLSYFAVYDGHGGRQIVDFLDEALEQNISTELQLPDEADIPERIARAFLITDMQSRKLEITTSGATAVSALLKVVDGERVLYVANVGDSRAVLCCEKYEDELPEATNHLAKRLSYDHRAEDEGEQQRIKEAGGFIARSRVLGILAVTRSFGDHGMKDFVSANPYITVTNLSACGDTPFLILACDGVWDVLTDYEAMDLILQRYNAEGPFSSAAELLVTTAIQKGSADNVTAVVIFL